MDSMVFRNGSVGGGGRDHLYVSPFHSLFNVIFSFLHFCAVSW